MRATKARINQAVEATNLAIARYNADVERQNRATEWNTALRAIVGGLNAVNQDLRANGSASAPGIR